ncbi:hypothetical protein DL768_001820 [Monosporascus sp. mg162]|nr:hypothetical protein DL768_001820 [Monosporascus sp. mg162]
MSGNSRTTAKLPGELDIDADITSRLCRHQQYPQATPWQQPRPKSAIFDARVWITEFVKLTESDPASAPRALGIAFKVLSGFGWSTGAQFQKSVGNVLIGIAKDLVRAASSSKRQERRLGNLRDFEGTVEKGEMLLVLVPPGSGCSTFLKILSSKRRILRVTVIYEGRQVFFGSRAEAKQYFQDPGFHCPDRQTVPDFLTPMTSPHERRARPGFEDIVPARQMILTIYAEHTVVEKQNWCAFYHQSAQAIASYLCDRPFKFANIFVFDILVYFMANLRREPGPFFFFCLVTLFATLSQSAMFRTLASITRTPERDMIPSALLGMGLMIYAGFTMPTAYMPGWSRWMGCINPLAYSSDALMANEFHGREFERAGMVPQGPGYEELLPESRNCSVVGSEHGSSVINGDRYINLSFEYHNSHMWRNVGILCGSTLLFFAAYLVMAEFQKPPKTRGELPIFRKVFHWEDLCYDIKVKGGAERRLLDHVDGWVKPGVSPVLMGDTPINGIPTDATFQHQVGYVQQQDIHLSTMTVPENLEFSAVLRQSSEISRKEKLQYVDHVIEILEMQEFAGAVIGVPGEGLNVEQRKCLTIGVELAARPRLLVFFDEPTSGPDSQTSWAISVLIRKLANSGQAVLGTIHQPSAILFDQFIRLLLIAPGGKTVFFGDLGKNSPNLIDYSERNGAPAIPADANPAEWTLEVIKPPKDGSEGIDWHQTWRDSPEYQDVKKELARLRALASTRTNASVDDKFPVYIWSKTALIALSSLYLGFSYNANNSIQGLQNQLWAIFMFLVLFVNINEQTMPIFVPQRNLYESRERPSKIHRWTTYIMASILIELFWNSIMAVIMYFCWYYPVDTFAHLTIVWIDLPETAGVLTSLLWMLCILFGGIGVPRADLPGFWTFMYRASPATYLVGGTMSTAVANTDITCADYEVLHLVLPSGGSMSCDGLLSPFAEAAGSRVLDPAALDKCGYCPLGTTNDFLAQFELSYVDSPGYISSST